MYVISIRNTRMREFQTRMGSLWSTECQTWNGTIGKNIDRNLWIWKRKIRQHCRLTLGQLGCYDSHVHVWKHCVQTKQNLFVVEDDANLTPHVLDTLTVFWERFQNREFDFVYIGHNNHTVPKQYITDFIDDPNVVIPHGCQGLFAYVITPRGAQKLLDKAVPYDQPVDVYVQHRTETDKDFQCYAMYPSPFYVVPCESDTKLS